MKAKEFIEGEIEKVWEEFYINYDLMNDILKPSKESYHKVQEKILEKKSYYKKFSEQVDCETLLDKECSMDRNEISNKFYNQFILELKKVDFFSTQNINKVILPKIEEIKKQIKHARDIDEFTIYKETFELAIKEIYKDLNLSKSFLEINEQIKNRLLHKYNKYNYLEGNNNNISKTHLNELIINEEDSEEEIKPPRYNLEQNINDYVKNKTNIYKNLNEINNQINAIKLIFERNFSFKYKTKCEKELKNYVSKVKISGSQNFYLGFFIGLLSFQLLIICILAYYYDIDMDNDPDFHSVFPMFRGFFIICFFWWIHGLNIYVWMKADISYRVIFQIDNNYSMPIQIFKRAAIFSFILLSCVLIYMIKRIYKGFFFGIFDPIPINMLPLICWGALIAYWFCPFEIWNYDGRAFLGNLCKDSFGSFLFKCGFKNVFFMSHVCTFISTLRDIEYTVCYYAYYDAPLWAKKEYCRKSRGIYFVLSFIPNFTRILQNFREMYDSKKLFPKLYNVCNYALSITLSLLSFFWPKHPSVHIWWLVLSFISSCTHFAWDCIMDFGFFQKNSLNWPLRDKLYYSPKGFYYFILLYDFIMRYFWLITISPEVLGSFFRPETLTIVLGCLEILRRGLWDFLKVENKHIDISKEYKVSNDVEMPFIKKNGRYINNETNILNIMRMNREEKIQFEIEKIREEKKPNAPKYLTRNVTDLNEGKPKINQELNKYLEKYKLDTKFNIN